MSVSERTSSAPPPGSTSTPALVASDLVKTYGKGDKAVHALTGVSFTVAAGTVVGLLGPNGAGKSTTVKILTTLSRADSGSARVAGLDVDRQAAEVRRVIGYVPQQPCFDPMATGRENLVLQGRVHGLSAAASRRRADDLLERFGLAAAAGRLAGTWSGGMQRKLDVALGLTHSPQVLFLDEPTTGLDPGARADMWTEIERLTRTDGLSVLLTTHYLEEADHLADQLVIVDRGAVVAAGSPHQLKAELDGDAVQVELESTDLAERARQTLLAASGAAEVTIDGRTVRTRLGAGSSALPGVLAALDAAGIALASVTVARPSLDDVYLRHAGRAFRAADEAAAKAVA
ncbi:MAG TPA: ATP-binding cassette domain-containing protein [Jiangellaceae bacterium]